MTTPVTNTTGTTAVTNKSTMGALGAGDFLQLLTTQLKNQDPTQPVDNSQMIAQLAQFSTLSNSTEMTATLKTISEQLATLNTKFA